MSQLQQDLSDAQLAAEREIISLEHIKSRLIKFKNISKKSTEIQREAIELFVSEIICYDDNIDINLHFDEIFEKEKSEPKPMSSSVNDMNIGSDMNELRAIKE
jgi:tRNA splicing endonuclease